MNLEEQQNIKREVIVGAILATSREMKDLGINIDRIRIWAIDGYRLLRLPEDTWYAGYRRLVDMLECKDATSKLG